ATLHNLDEVRRLDVRKGDRVIVQRAGDVIPEVVRVETEAREKGKDYPEFDMPARCPVCDGPVIHPEGEVAYYCGNREKREQHLRTDPGREAPAAVAHPSCPRHPPCRRHDRRRSRPLARRSIAERRRSRRGPRSPSKRFGRGAAIHRRHRRRGRREHQGVLLAAGRAGVSRQAGARGDRAGDADPAPRRSGRSLHR
ncbi:MAG: hypothetical protein E6I49_14865, partial [Chloroflexi bacterium]